MDIIINSLLIVITLPLLLLMAFLLLEIIAAFLPQRSLTYGERRSAAILIPAHDEELVLARTLESLQPQLQQDDRILVVADNCSDSTARIARQAGVDVLERVDLQNRGKGFALAAGMLLLSNEPPDVVIVVDADCIVESGSIDTLARAAVGYDRPVQALYLMTAPEQASLGSQVSAFAFKFKNLVRARGLSRLGFPVNLTGTGMAFPWRDIAALDIANGNIVEDMAMGVELMLRGKGALYVDAAKVHSSLPASDHASDSQRTRWEHGHMETIQVLVPRLLREGLKGKPRLFCNALDLAIPPLSLFVMLNIACLLLLLVASALFDIEGLLAWHFSVGLLLAIGIVAAWYRYARDLLPASSLRAVPAYAINKFGLYRRFFGNRQTQWVRTDRDD